MRVSCLSLRMACAALVLSLATSVTATPYRPGDIALSMPPGPGEVFLMPAAADGPDFWQVAGVASGDKLNMRTGPSTGNRVIARLSNGQRLRNLGCQQNGSTRWCQVQTPDGSLTGWVAGRYLREAGGQGAAIPTPGNPPPPVLSQRPTGEIEVSFGNGCTILYSPRATRLAQGASCLRAQIAHADDAAKRYVREQGGATGAGGSAAYSGTGLMGTQRLYGRLARGAGGRYALSITGGPGACAGLLPGEPGASRSQSIRLSCSGGVTGTAILIRNKSGTGFNASLVFSNGKGGFVQLN